MLIMLIIGNKRPIVLSSPFLLMFNILIDDYKHPYMFLLPIK